MEEENKITVGSLVYQLAKFPANTEISFIIENNGLKFMVDEFSELKIEANKSCAVIHVKQ